MYNVKSAKAEEFICNDEILQSLQFAIDNCNDKSYLNEIITKAANFEGLTHREAITLLESTDKDIENKIFELAKAIKNKFYGNRIVMFAPLYLSNYCVNSCVYCPYHIKNKNIPRKKLQGENLTREVVALQDMGHKRLAIEAGEHPTINPIEYILECIENIYGINHKNGAIRRVNVNIAATSVENYKKLKDAKIGTYILFQETYNKENYKKLHPVGPKRDYDYHTEAMDRAMQGGIDDVGVGVLFGLDNYKYELVGLLMHKEHLEQVFGVGPHTISLPRMRPADDIDIKDFEQGLTDEKFAKLVAILRIAVPYTGLIISTREQIKVRERLLEVGVTQLSGGSKTSVGGYCEKECDGDSSQFEIADNRTLDEVVNWLLSLGYIPSFCTACYREGRTGDRFMRLVKSGAIANVCQPNALLTLAEYLYDYAKEDTKQIGFKVIEKELENIKNDKVKLLVKENLTAIKNGKRDFRL